MPWRSHASFIVHQATQNTKRKRLSGQRTLDGCRSGELIENFDVTVWQVFDGGCVSGDPELGFADDGDDSVVFLLEMK